jgi:hypothetical protein
LKYVIVGNDNSDMSNSGSSNKYNDPTLPGYDPSKPAGTAQTASTSKPTGQVSSSSINKYNDPTLPGYDSSRPAGTAITETTSTRKYNPPPRSSLPPHLRGYFPGPKL